MFHFPTFPPLTLCVQVRVTGHDSCRVSPFGNPRITARLAAPRGLSQPPTSFIGSWCQGIHRAPLLTWPQRCSRPLCSSQATDGTRSNPPQHPEPPTHTRADNPKPYDADQSPQRHPTPTKAPGPSGPNSVPEPPPHTPEPFHTPSHHPTPRTGKPEQKTETATRSSTRPRHPKRRPC